jgi:hypothetical protein
MNETYVKALRVTVNLGYTATLWQRLRLNARAPSRTPQPEASEAIIHCSEALQ